MNPRLRRLQSDYEKIKARFADWPRIRITGTRGTPPEFYQIEYDLTGLAKQMDGRITEVSRHVLEINLSLQYPRRAPTCRITTPIFHPNIDPSSVCIGDFWASSEALDSLIVRIGRMIAFQEYNVKSPLDGLAARWAAENAHLLPVDARPVEAPSAVLTDTEAPISIVTDLPTTEEIQQNGAAMDHPATPTAHTTDISLPTTLELVNLQARCRNCACLIQLEPAHLELPGIACPQCATSHLFSNPS